MYFAVWKPATDIFRHDRRWLVRMELAGVAPGDVRIDVRDNLLTVHGKRRDLKLQQGFVCHSLEICYTRFERTIGFTGLIDTNSIESDYRDGILNISLSTS